MRAVFFYLEEGPLLKNNIIDILSHSACQSKFEVLPRDSLDFIASGLQRPQAIFDSG
jgi:hypothetical protein